eukprot:m51a1_g4657 hypothetical protein (92) ;mRNA; r:50313-60205
MFEEHEDQMKLENWKKVKLPYCNLFQHMMFKCCRWSVDVKAIDISRPSKKQDKFYNGKYKGHVVKIQVVVNNQGIPMDVQGLMCCFCCVSQ